MSVSDFTNFSRVMTIEGDKFIDEVQFDLHGKHYQGKNTKLVKDMPGYKVSEEEIYVEVLPNNDLKVTRIEVLKHGSDDHNYHTDLFNSITVNGNNFALVDDGAQVSFEAF